MSQNKKQPYRQLVGGQGVIRMPASSWIPRRDIDRRSDDVVRGLDTQAKRAIAAVGALTLLGTLTRGRRAYRCSRRWRRMTQRRA